MHFSRKSLHSVLEVCIFQKKKPYIPLGRGEHEVRTSAAFWSLVSESSHLPSVLAVFEEGDGGGGGGDAQLSFLSSTKMV